MSEVASPSHGSSSGSSGEASPYVELERAAWAELAGTAETTLTRDEVVSLRWDPLESTCRHASLSIL